MAIVLAFYTEYQIVLLDKDKFPRRSSGYTTDYEKMKTWLPEFECKANRKGWRLVVVKRAYENITSIMTTNGYIDEKWTKGEEA